MEETWDIDGDTAAVLSIPDSVYSEIRQSAGSGSTRGKDKVSRSKFSGFGYDEDCNGEGNAGVRMQVEVNMKGMVIGRGGSKIREIQEQFNCKVNMGKNYFNCLFVWQFD